MPVFNAAAHIEECLESILAQSAKDWELIAVNDQSTDESKSILARYAQQDSRITCLDNPDKGIITALRLALSTSTGEYITRMDADDIMPANKLSLLRAQCAPGTVSTGKVTYFRSDGPLGDGYRNYADWLNSLIDHKTHWTEIYKECVIPSPAWMMQRATLVSIGAFDANRYPEDYDLVFRMYSSQIQVITIDKLVHHWRDHAERSSRHDLNYTDNRFLDIKLHYFLSIDHQKDKQLHIWGAGKKGKYCARYLLERGIEFDWTTDNPNKIGKDIYGQILKSSEDLSPLGQYLLLIASPENQAAIRAKPASGEYYWFC